MKQFVEEKVIPTSLKKEIKTFLEELDFKNYRFNKYKVVNRAYSFEHNHIIENLFDKNNNYLLIHQPVFEKTFNFTYLNEITLYKHCFENIKNKPNLLIGYNNYYLIEIDEKKKSFNVIDLERVDAPYYREKDPEIFLFTLKTLSIFLQGTNREEVKNYLKNYYGFFTTNKKEKEKLENIYNSLLKNVIKISFPSSFKDEKLKKEFGYFYDLRNYEVILFSSIIQGIRENYGDINRNFRKDLKTFKNKLLDLQTETYFKNFYNYNKFLDLYSVYALSTKKYELIFSIYFIFGDDKIKFEEAKLLNYFLTPIISKKFSINLFDVKESFNKPLNTFEDYDLCNKFFIDIYYLFVLRLDLESNVIEPIFNLYRENVKNIKNHEIFYKIVTSSFFHFREVHKNENLIPVVFSTIFNFYKNNFDKDLNNLEQWKKIKNSLNMGDYYKNVIKETYESIKNKNLDLNNPEVWKKELENNLYKRTQLLIVEQKRKAMDTYLGL